MQAGARTNALYFGVRFLLFLRAAVRIGVAGALLLGAAPTPAFHANSGTSWPMMLGDLQHTSRALDPAITNTNAPTFGIKWMANLYNADLGSPVEAYNSRLNTGVVYVGTQRGDVFAIDSRTGQTIWSTNLGLNAGLRASPAIDSNGSVWIGSSYNAQLYKLNGATGAIECTVKAPAPIVGSPIAYVSSTGAETIYWTYEDTGSSHGALVATQAGTCGQVFSFTNYSTTSGSMVEPAWAMTQSSTPVTLIGSQAPDAREYEINAKTGAVLWNFPAYDPAPSNYDIAAATTIMMPSGSGFPGGAAYFTTRYGDVYAVNLSTGSLFWYDPIGSGASMGSRSSAALDSSHLVFGFGNNTGFGGGGGVYSVSPYHGTVQWIYPDAAEVISSPALIGPGGSEVVAFGDMNGAFNLLDENTGTNLYMHQTRGYITASPAEAYGTIYITSSDGFLYAFAPGGSNASAPATTITFPAPDAPVSNPAGTLAVTGNSTDASGVSAVQVAVQLNGNSGPWYNAATATWQRAPVANQALLSSPGAASTGWTFDLPVPNSGDTYTVYANTINTANIMDAGQHETFTVSPAPSEPTLVIPNPYPAPQSSFGLHGTAFLPNEQIAISLFGNVVKTVTATGTGVLPSTTIAVPATAPLGPTSVNATGQTSGYSASAQIVIGNSWTQGSHDALNTSFEPNDPVIARSLALGNGTVLEPSWTATLGSPVNSSPAVFGSTVYVGAANGVFSALAIDTGAKLWTGNTRGHQAIETAPAIDNRYEFFGATDGSLYVYDTSGNQVKQVLVGGALTSPVLGNNQIYVTSDNGTINDVEEGKLKVAWTKTLNRASHASAAYDAAKGTVVAVDDSGTVSGFNALTGVLRWQYTTGGPIVSAPVIANGNVLVGSTDGKLYSLDEAKGALQWQQAMTGAINVAPVMSAATTPVQISVIDSNGVIETLTGTGNLISQNNTGTSNPVGLSAVQGNLVVTYGSGLVALVRGGTTGPFAWSYKTGSTLSTQAAIVNGTVYVGAADGHLYAFTPQGATPLSKVHPGVSVSGANGWACTTP